MVELCYDAVNEYPESLPSISCSQKVINITRNNLYMASAHESVVYLYNTYTLTQI